jgi:hypothetical protein
MSETTSADLPFSEDETENEPIDVPLADPDAVAEADQDEAEGDHSNLAADDPNRTW